MVASVSGISFFCVSIFFKPNRTNSNVQKLPSTKASSGKSVNRTTEKAICWGSCCPLAPLLMSVGKSKATNRTNASTVSANPMAQILVDRIAGIATAVNNIGGTHMANQIKCIETNALVGGSQPHAPHKPLMCGMLTLPSAVAPKINVAIPATRNISFLNMRLQSKMHAVSPLLYHGFRPTVPREGVFLVYSDA